MHLRFRPQRAQAKTIVGATSMSDTRDYNQETKDACNHKYAYNFDFEVMHPFMLRSFEPFFREGNLLELGSFRGEFTKRLIPYFDDITCVEASNEAVVSARRELNNKVNDACIGTSGRSSW